MHRELNNMMIARHSYYSSCLSRRPIQDHARLSCRVAAGSNSLGRRRNRRLHRSSAEHSFAFTAPRLPASLRGMDGEWLMVVAIRSQSILSRA